MQKGKFKFHWGHGLALAMAAFIIFILSMIFFFPNGQENSELVANDYYQEELSYQEVIDAKHNAELLPKELQPEYVQNEEGIKVIFPDKIVDKDSRVRFHLYRIDNQRLDIKKATTLDIKNAFFIPKNILVTGGYILKVYWQREGKKYQIDYELTWR